MKWFAEQVANQLNERKNPADAYVTIRGEATVRQVDRTDVRASENTKGSDL